MKTWQWVLLYSTILTMGMNILIIRRRIQDADVFIRRNREYTPLKIEEHMR